MQAPKSEIKLLVLDVDGVMTDGTLYYTAEGETMKAFNVQDGMGLKFIRRAGVELAVISGRESEPLRARLQDLGITRAWLKCNDKVAALQELCSEINIAPEESAFMGDDLIDLAAMEVCGYAIAPADACKDILAMADFVTERGGGKGAVRDACEHLAEMRGIKLSDFCGPEHPY